MKTRYALLHILTALLSVFSVQTLYAQAKQDALYIFRNDGQFNAFFFGDIDRIEYSKIDTLGVEQADYVVQEVWALDTVYRIPISAIDSIAFVTPEKKIKADVFCPDKSIANYIVASDTINWIRLASNTPAAMIPKVGDKLLIEEKSQFIPRGFVGLVTSVENGSNGYTVMTGDLEITDVYERLVVKAAGATPLTGQARRRGLFDGTEWHYANEEPIVFPDMSGSVSIQGSRVLYDKHDVSLTADGSGSLSFNFVPRIQYRGFLFVDVKYGLQYTQDITFDNKTSWDLMFTGSLTGNVDIPLKGIDKDFDAISLGVNCGLFINAQITGLTAGASWQSHYIGRDYLNNMIKDISSILTDQDQLIPAHKHSITFSEDSLSYTVSSQGKYAFSAGVYAKAEASFTLPFKKKEVKTKIGVRLEAGGRLTFEAPVWTPDVAYDLLTTTSVYQLLNKETNITASAYGKFSAYAQFNNQAWSANPEATLGSANLFGLVPNITSIEVAQDKEKPIRPYRLLFSSSTTNRKVPTLIPVGFALFDADQKLVKDSINAYYWVGLKKDNWSWRNLTNAYNCVLNIDPGKGKEKTYIAYPMVEYLGYKILADKSKEFTVDPARIDIAQRELFVGADLGSMEIEVVPNMANMEVKVEGDWLNETKPIWLDHLNELNIYWPELPEDVKDRRGVVRLTGKSQKGEVLVEDSIVVHQYVPFMELSDTSLEFNEKGGTKTVTIGNTNVKDITVSSNTEYITATLQDKTITVTIDKNTTDQTRGGTVYVEGKASNGQTISFPIIVTQKEGKPVPQGGGDLLLSTYYVEVPSRGSMASPVEIPDVKVLTEGIESVECTSDKDFVELWTRRIGNDILISIRTHDNATLEERYATVTATAKLKDGTTRTAKIVVMQKSYFHISRIKLTSLCSWTEWKYLGYNEETDEFIYDNVPSKIDDWDRPGCTYEEYYDQRDTLVVTGDPLGPLHVKVTFDAGEPRDPRDPHSYYEFSFDLPEGFNSQFANNLEYDHTDSWASGALNTRRLRATHVPLSKVSGSESSPQNTWAGTVADGVIITDCSRYFHAETMHDNNYVENSENSVSLIIDFDLVSEE